MPNDLIGNTPINVLNRRYAGERWWRVEIEELLASQREIAKKLKTLRTRHAKDVETITLVAEIQEEIIEQMAKLGDLYHYRDPEEKP